MATADGASQSGRVGELVDILLQARIPFDESPPWGRPLAGACQLTSEVHT